MKTKAFLLILMVLLSAANIVKAAPDAKVAQKPFSAVDSTYFFIPSNAIKIQDNGSNTYTHAYSFDLMLSGDGFGLGFNYQRLLTKDLHVFTNFFISGARNTDEFEDTWDPDKNEYVVADKINRLYMMPLTVGLHQYILSDVLTETLQPYIFGGLGPTFILSTPYNHEFFNAFGHADFYCRFGAFVGFGANFGVVANTLLGVSLKYYYIPFGGNGIESVLNHPIKDFGGVFLNLTIGAKY